LKELEQARFFNVGMRNRQQSSLTESFGAVAVPQLTRSGLLALMTGPGGAITDTRASSATWKGAGWSPYCRIVNQRPPKPGYLLIPRSRLSPVIVVEDMAKPRQKHCRRRYRSPIVGI
jgi:hypothetical protein